MARIAIIGTGISGLGAAWLLHPDHEITVYEKAPRLGGHARTVSLDYDGAPIAVDTGFIVFNRPNYPNLTGLFAALGVATHKSDMTFATSIRDGWLEWGARDLRSVFGQWRNLARPRFALLVRDVMKFNAGAEAMAAHHPELTLAGLIEKMGLGDWFTRYYLLPMAGAIWSCPLPQMMQFPARTLIRFFANHHLLSASGQPQWYTVTGGAREYVRRLAAPFVHRVRTGCGAAAVTRMDGKVHVRDTLGETHSYDEVVMACHGDETRALLKDIDKAENEALSAFRYQKNIAVLHRDVRVMPKRKACWAAWNYVSDGAFDHSHITVTYWMNLLQGIDQSRPLFVSLNPARPIAPELVFDRAEFDHPVFDEAALAAQGAVAELQGRRGTWFCGAHLRHGFHEDGLASAVTVARRKGSRIPWDESCVPDAMQRKYPQNAVTGAFPAPIAAG